MKKIKKIAIVTRKLIAGGIEKALISMIEEIPKDKYEITLFVMARGGEFEKYVPNYVKIKCLYGEENSTVEKIKNQIKSYSFIKAIKIGIYTSIAMNAKFGYEQERYLAKILPNEKNVYDIAIAYHVPASFPVVYVVDHLNAKTKIAFIHSDIGIYKKEMKRYEQYYSLFDKIYCVSKYGCEKFKEEYSKLKSKTSVFYNIINREKIKSLGDKEIGFEDDFDGIRILTVGRLTQEKGYDMVPIVLSKLITERYNVKWYCIGEGEERSEIESLIKAYKLEGKMILMGSKLNPYPFFKECDIYVQPSRHEGYCITLAEARIFNKPIVTTDFIGALEQVTNGEDGLVVSFASDDIYIGVKKIIDCKELKESLVTNLRERNIEIVSDIDKLLIWR